jgi:hypothetical protein
MYMNMQINADCLEEHKDKIQYELIYIYVYLSIYEYVYTDIDEYIRKYAFMSIFEHEYEYKS